MITTKQLINIYKILQFYDERNTRDTAPTMKTVANADFLWAPLQLEYFKVSIERTEPVRQYAQISFAEASFRIFPLSCHIDSPTAEVPLVIFPEVLVAEERIGVNCVCVCWCIVLPV